MEMQFRARRIACRVALTLGIGTLGFGTLGFGTLGVGTLGVGTARLFADEPPNPASVATKPAATKDAATKDAATKDPAANDRVAKEAAAKAAAARARDAEEYELQKLFADTLDQVERNYVKDISHRELMEAAIRGVLAKLDPYSNYISPDDLGRFKTAVDNQFGGIGIQVDLPRKGQLVIVSPLYGSPAYKAGLQAGDEIVEIEGQSTDDMQQIDDAIRRLKGEAGSKVTITVFRPSTRRRKKVTIEREIVQLETVMGDQRKSDDRWDFMLDHEKRIGYIRITAFGRDTQRDLQAALEELQKEHLRGLILDLRFNPGGLLTSAIGVSDLFISDGRIVSTAGRNSTPRSWDAQKSGTFEGFPMVVLVNRYSASASEIVSACLQDHHRAVIIGERTWGKGSVQNVIELEGGKSALKLTTAGYQRPSGKNIHKAPDAKDTDEWGVSPNESFEVKLDDLETARLAQYRHRRDILAVNHSVQPADADNSLSKPSGSIEASAKNPAEEKAAEEKPADLKSADKKPDSQKPDAAKPADQKPSDDKSTPKKPDGDKPENKKGDDQKGDDKSAASKMGDKKPGEKKPDEKPGDTKPRDGEQENAKPEPSKPAQSDAAKSTPTKQADADEPDQNEEKRPAFVDRQLQKALDYLSGELAKAR
jgi:carboxyl-terminal processing protease